MLTVDDVERDLLRTFESAVYAASPVKRARATKAEMEYRRDRLHSIVEGDQPMTVRHAYYRAVVAGLVPKTEAGYGRVQRTLAEMRERGQLPFEWIVDNTRWMRKPHTFDSLEACLADAAASYRRALWSDAPETVEVWCESDSVAGTVADVCAEWDVPLMVTRGYSSKSFAHAAARQIEADGRPANLYYLGDLDPAGVEIERSLCDALVRYAPAAAAEGRISFQRVALTRDQADEYDLPGTPAKNRKQIPFTGEAVEIEALPAPVLRSLVTDAIAQHLDPHRLDVLLTVEDEERQLLRRIADRQVVG